MYLEAVRLVSDWLAGTLKDWQNVDQGVNALSPAVPRWGADPAPPAVTVEDETRKGHLARNRPTSVVPGLGVRLFREIARPALPGTIAGGIDAEAVEVAALLFLEDVDTEEAVRNELYLARAVTRSLRQLARNENKPVRQANSIHLVHCSQLRVFPRQPVGQDQDTQVTTAIVSTWFVRDLAP